MIAAVSEMNETFGLNWPFFIAQAVNVLIVVGLFILATRAILARGKGWEVPVWIVLSFLIPVIMPIIALIHFRKSKATPISPGTPSTLP